jgi:transketolase
MFDLTNVQKKATRFGFGEALVTLGERHDNVVVLGGDITGSVMTSLFKEKFPERFFSIGVAEQNLIQIAVGLSFAGKIPFAATYGAFASTRCLDQIRVSVCYNEANVKIGGGHAGISVGPDGATHQALEEIATTRVMPHMTTVVPCDYTEAYKATVAIGEMKGPAYLRFGREAFPTFTGKDTPFRLGKAEVFEDGKDVAIIACGVMVYEALVAHQNLAKKGIHARVINLHTIKPIDRETIIRAAKDCGGIVTAEEHQIYAGMGSAVAEQVVQHFPVPMEFVGVHDRFGGSGDPMELMKHFGLTHNEIEEAVHRVLKRKNK